MAVPAALQAFTSSWSSYYGDHQLVSVLVRYVHLASTVVGGGAAIAVDRLVLRAMRQGEEARRALLAQLRGSHVVIVPALVLVTLSGVLMAAADLDTFLESRLFFVKLAFVALLLINGACLVAAERAAVRGGGRGWGRLAGFSAASLILWLVTVGIGTWLTVGA